MAELAFISLGSNIEPSRNLPAAVRRLGRLGRLRALSAAYHTEPVGPPGQPPFVNAAALLETDLPPAPLTAALKETEAALGRVRTGDRYAPRPIDLDLCLYDTLQGTFDGVELPDPEILERPYLALTLAELAPDFPYPTTGEPLQAIAGRLASGADLHLDAAITRAMQAAAGLPAEPTRP